MTSYPSSDMASSVAVVRPSIWIGDGDLERVTNQTVEAIRQSNRLHPRIFCAGTGLVRVQRDEKGRLVPVTMTVNRMVNVLARCIDWYRMRKGEPVAANPPRNVALDVLALPSWPFPRLTAIVRHPTFTKTRLIGKPGYDGESGLFYDPGTYSFPEVSEFPDEEELALARNTLLVEQFGDFPFANKSSLAHTGSATILPFVRHLINGPTPIHSIDKPSPGTGGTLLGSAIAFPALGHPPPAITLPRTEDEQRRTLFAALSAFPEFLLLDNAESLQGAALAAALTSTEIHDRIVGSSESRSVPVTCVWLCSGNNLSYSREIRRRSVPIRLDARMEQPERRTKFRHPDLLDWMCRNRRLIVWSVLTIVQAWRAQGSRLSKKHLGSFEPYAAVMGGILDVAGIPGFLEDRDTLTGTEVEEHAMFRGFFDAWWHTFGRRPVKVTEMTDLAKLHLNLDAPSETGLRVELGRRLAKKRDCRFGNFILHAAASQRAGSHSWFLEEAAEKSEASAGKAASEFGLVQ